MDRRSFLVVLALMIGLPAVGCSSSEAPPVGESAEVGRVVMVKWSRAPFWFPATITQKKGDRYYVRFHDGDEEWTTADNIAPEDLRPGDRVDGNWKGRGMFYPGRITQRKGNMIHIQYDDGDQEDTTLTYIRVQRLPRR